MGSETELQSELYASIVILCLALGEVTLKSFITCDVKTGQLFIIKLVVPYVLYLSSVASVFLLPLLTEAKNAEWRDDKR